MCASALGLGSRIFLVQLHVPVLRGNEDEGGCTSEFLPLQRTLTLVAVWVLIMFLAFPWPVRLVFPAG